MKLTDLTGKTYGHLTVVKESHRKNGRRYWECLCDCGKAHTVATASLTSGNTKSCGCHHYDAITKHGHGKRGNQSKTYHAWFNARQRCELESKGCWENYGARGITFCDRWRDFCNFLSDMGESPPDTVLDRIDVNKGYSPDNCRWLPKHLSNDNCQDTIRYEMFGVKATAREWSEACGLTQAAFRNRVIRKGYEVVITKDAATAIRKKYGVE